MYPLFIAHCLCAIPCRVNRAAGFSCRVWAHVYGKVDSVVADGSAGGGKWHLLDSDMVPVNVSCELSSARPMCHVVAYSQDVEKILDSQFEPNGMASSIPSRW